MGLFAVSNRHRVLPTPCLRGARAVGRGDGRQHGFLRDGRRYRTLDVPGGGNIATGINDRGDIVLPDARTAATLPVTPS
jgi:hypothetical protein